MNYAEVISLDDTLDVSINGDKKTKFRVSICDSGRIKLIPISVSENHRTRRIPISDNDVYSIDLFVKEENDGNPKNGL